MLKDNVALITGGSSGIGRAVALAWAREGAKVVVSDVDRGGGEETVEQVRTAGGEAIFIAADVGKPEECEALVRGAVEKFGRLDIACSNAGIGGPQSPTADYPLEGWATGSGSNLSGVFYGMKYQLPAMLKNGGGAIINMASILGAVGFAGAPAYAAAKHGVVGLTQTAALEYSAQGVRINAVGPGFIHTPMISALEDNKAVNDMLVAAHPIGRLGRAEEVAELVLWLSSEKASVVTGGYYPVDGGYTPR